MVPVPVARWLLLLLAVALSPARADHVYLRSGEIVEGKVLSQAPGGVELEVAPGQVKRFPAAQIMAVERTREVEVPYLVTETDWDLVWQAAVSHRETARQLIRETEGQQDANGSWREARVWLQRAEACLQRLRELYPERASQVDAEMQKVKELEELCLKAERPS